MRAALALVLLVSACRLEPAAPADLEGGGLEGEPDARPSPAPAAEPPAGRSVLEGVPAEGVPTEGVLLIPVVGVPPGALVDTFGDARGEGRSHDALDIAAPRGRPVVAAAAGRVARLFESEKGGTTAYVLGLDGRTVYYYAHLEAYADGLAEGAAVRQGDPLGTVGDSGNAVPGDTHLHFAIWRTDDPARVWDGAPVNPYPLFVGR